MSQLDKLISFGFLLRQFMMFLRMEVGNRVNNCEKTMRCRLDCRLLLRFGKWKYREKLRLVTSAATRRFRQSGRKLWRSNGESMELIKTHSQIPVTLYGAAISIEVVFLRRRGRTICETISRVFFLSSAGTTNQGACAMLAVIKPAS